MMNNDVLVNKEKKKIFIYLVVTFAVVCLAGAFILFYNKVFVMEYAVDDITFKYLSSFKVSRKDNEILVVSKDEVANINISVDEGESDYLNSDYDAVSNKVVNELVDSTKYRILSSECVDHMCTSLYESDKEKLKIVVEFRENILVTYKIEVASSKFDKYVEGFDTIVNSFVKEKENQE